MINHPAYTTEEAHNRQTFLALMWALSYPGRVHHLPSGSNAYHAIADTLLDLETSYYTPDEHLADYLERTGARALPPERAAYHFYPALDETLLEIIQEASPGTPLNPDQAAAFFIGCQFEAGTTWHLSGPGVSPAAPVTIQVAGIPADFWNLRAAHRYPLGWDVYLVDGSRVIGLPRTTQLIGEE